MVTQQIDARAGTTSGFLAPSWGTSQILSPLGILTSWNWASEGCWSGLPEQGQSGSED